MTWELPQLPTTLRSGHGAAAVGRPLPHPGRGPQLRPALPGGGRNPAPGAARPAAGEGAHPAARVENVGGDWVNLVSIGWFKGKITGNSGNSHRNHGKIYSFRCRFSLSRQPIEGSICGRCGFHPA